MPIRWESPTREVVGPTSAQSATIRIVHEGMTDKVQTVARPAAGGTQVYDVPGVAVGTSSFTVDFYSGSDGSGTRMRRAQGTMTVDNNGATVPTVSGAPDDTVHHIGIALQPAGPDMPVGEDAEIILTAYDEENALVALPDARVWSVSSSSNGILEVNIPSVADGDWLVRGVARGNVTLTAKLDGKSATYNVRVKSDQAFARIANAAFEEISSIDFGSQLPVATGLKLGQETEPRPYSTKTGYSAFINVDGSSRVFAGSVTFLPNYDPTVIVYRHGDDQVTKLFTIQDVFFPGSDGNLWFINLAGDERTVNLFSCPVGAPPLTDAKWIAGFHEFRSSLPIKMPDQARQLWLTDATTNKLLAGAEWNPSKGKRLLLVVAGIGSNRNLVSFFRNE